MTDARDTLTTSSTRTFHKLLLNIIHYPYLSIAIFSSIKSNPDPPTPISFLLVTATISYERSTECHLPQNWME